MELVRKIKYDIMNNEFPLHYSVIENDTEDLRKNLLKTPKVLNIYFLNIKKIKILKIFYFQLRMS